MNDRYTGSLSGLTFNLDGSQNVTVKVNSDIRELYDKLKDHTVTMELKKASNQRSKTANDFCWALCTDIGNAQSPPVSKQDVYRDAIKHVGVYEPLPIRKDAVDYFRRSWESRGTGWFTEDVDESKIKGYRLIFAYYGSSVYDTAQMSRLIDFLVNEAEQYGIPIPISKEREKLLAEWGAR